MMLASLGTQRAPSHVTREAFNARYWLGASVRLLLHFSTASSGDQGARALLPKAFTGPFDARFGIPELTVPPVVVALLLLVCGAASVVRTTRVP